jgi:hypothetical protein
MSLLCLKVRPHATIPAAYQRWTKHIVEYRVWKVVVDGDVNCR